MEPEIFENQIAILKEVASIGMGHASTALSQLLKKDVKIQNPDFEVVKKKEIYKTFSNTDIYIGLHLQILEGLNGQLLCFFKKNDAIKLINSLNPNASNTTVFDDFDISVIKEISNILAGSFLNAIAKFSDLTLIPSLPHLSLDSAASIFDFIIGNMKDEHIQLLLFKSRLIIGENKNKLDGMIILALDIVQSKILLEKLKIKYDN